MANQHSNQFGDMRFEFNRRRAKASLISSGDTRPSKPKSISEHEANARAELSRFRDRFKAAHGRSATDLDVARYVHDRVSGKSEAASLAPSHGLNSLSAQMGLVAYKPTVRNEECRLTLGALAVDQSARPEPQSQPSPLPNDWDRLPKAGHLPAGEKQALDARMGLTTLSGAGTANVKSTATRQTFGGVTS